MSASNEPGGGLTALAREAAANVSDASPAKAHEKVDRHDVEAVNSAASRSLYVSRQAIHPKLVHGTFRNIKWVMMTITLGIYYILPWIRWDRGPNAPDQAVLLDMPGRRFYFFFIEIWPQEIYFVTGLLVLASLVLFLATALFGRVWCGYACPQTVWTDLFIMVERMIEGDRNKRLKLDKTSMSLSKFVKKVSKHSVWLLIAVATGGAWVFYFADAPQLARDLLTLDAPIWLSASLPPPPICWAVSRASRCAPICAPGHGFRVRWWMISLFLSAIALTVATRAAPIARVTRGRAVATASTASSVLWRAPWALISVMGTSLSAFSARCALMPATTSWTRLIARAG